jgi:hypothetical protein
VDHTVDHAAADQRFADRHVRRPLPVRQQVADGYGQEVVGMHQTHGWHHNAMPI